MICQPANTWHAKTPLLEEECGQYLDCDFADQEACGECCVERKPTCPGGWDREHNSPEIFLFPGESTIRQILITHEILKWSCSLFLF